jgi:hypothetical protein
MAVVSKETEKRRNYQLPKIKGPIWVKTKTKYKKLAHLEWRREERRQRGWWARNLSGRDRLPWGMRD